MFQKIKDLRYQQLASNAEKPEFTKDLKTLTQQLVAEGYHGQFGQDKWVLENLLSGKKNGTFVDIGANDGISFSNTFYLEQKGWKGLAIEPIPSVYEKLVKNRKCITVHGCIGPKSEKRQFRVITGYPEMLSGLIDEYNPKHIKRIDKELNSHGGDYEDIEVDCFNFNELLEKHNIDHVDYLSIDVEGIEYKILKTIDFDRVNISVIGVENNYADYKIPQLLIKKGFKFHSIVGDEFYMNSGLKKH